MTIDSTIDRYQLRPFNRSEQDYIAITHLANRIYPDYPEDPKSAELWDGIFTGEQFNYRVIAELDGQVVGTGNIGHTPFMFNPRKFWVNVNVAPELQGSELGGQIYEHLLAMVAEYQPIAFFSGTRSDWQHKVAFLTERGFREKMRYYESRLDVANFDARPFAGKIEAVEAQGLRLAALSELNLDEPFLRELFDAIEEISLDVPAPEAPTKTEYENWRHRFEQNPDRLLEGYFVALDGERVAGVSQLWKIYGLRDLQTGLTGVRREYRRRGIALALKLKALAFAQAYGAPYIRTGNEENNRAMLSINEALGFYKLPPWIDYELVLS